MLGVKPTECGPVYRQGECVTQHRVGAFHCGLSLLFFPEHVTQLALSDAANLTVHVSRWILLAFLTSRCQRGWWGTPRCL